MTKGSGWSSLIWLSRIGLKCDRSTALRRIVPKLFFTATVFSTATPSCFDQLFARSTRTLTSDICSCPAKLPQSYAYILPGSQHKLLRFNDLPSRCRITHKILRTWLQNLAHLDR